MIIGYLDYLLPAWQAFEREGNLMRQETAREGEGRRGTRSSRVLLAWTHARVCTLK